MRISDWSSDVCSSDLPGAHVSLSHNVGRLGLIERENGTILNAALATLAQHVMASLERALAALGIAAPLYISQNDGTLISAAEAARYPVLTIGSGPTNRSEERRVGKECVSTCRSRWTPYH